MCAAVAQLVEHDLAKVGVTSSSLVSRSKILLLVLDELVATRCPGGGIGRHKGFKIPRSQERAGSSPALGTISS